MKVRVYYLLAGVKYEKVEDFLFTYIQKAPSTFRLIFEVWFFLTNTIGIIFLRI